MGRSIQYVIETRGNRLYGGGYGGRRSYLSFGQQTFLADLLTVALRRGFRVEVVSDSATRFPVLSRLAAAGVTLTVVSRPAKRLSADIVLVDEITSDAWIERLTGTNAIKLIHNPNDPGPFIESASAKHFVTMTESGLRKLRSRYSHHSVVLVHQGVDLLRLMPRPRNAGRRRPVALVLGRLSYDRAESLRRVIRHLATPGWMIDVAGYGPARQAILASGNGAIGRSGYVHWTAIARMLAGCDLVVSSGRGVMEGLASGVPCLCAGLGYGGPVSATTVPVLLERNLTGYGGPTENVPFGEDLATALAMTPDDCRSVAEAFFDADIMLDKLVELA